MKIKNACFCLLIVFICNHAFAQQECPVIPMPDYSEQGKGAFVVNDRTSIVIKDTSLHSLAVFLQISLKRYQGINVNITEKGKSRAIILKKSDSLHDRKEAYTLQMNKSSVVITAADEEGLFDGIVSFLQLAGHASVQGSGIAVECWNIRDTPAYEWRGLMLDESRHFFGKDVVKMILDWMAFYKLNRFHWHLTDSPGWRLELKQYPRLTAVGAIGNHSDAAAPAQYYTQDDIREIVQYARERYITVIPEIDMPGHANASNRAYPEFSGGNSGKFGEFTFNPGKEGTYRYLANILRETATLFPSGIIHLGGDEVSFGSKSWTNDAGVKKLMSEEHLSDLKAVEYYFLRRMADTALKTYHKVIAWDEAADAGLPVDKTIIFWWRHDRPEQLSKALRQGYEVVFCPRVPLYFDFVQDSAHRQGRKWKGDFSSLKKVYAFSPGRFPEAVEKSGQVAGMQANLWTETVRTKKRLEFLLFPRIAALSEAAWTSSGKRNYQQFLFRLKSHLALYRKAGIYYYDPITPGRTPEAVDK